eukprot:scaffold3559_cov284-Chaetoceros_neogracile.AAC.39
MKLITQDETKNDAYDKKAVLRDSSLVACTLLAKYIEEPLISSCLPASVGSRRIIFFAGEKKGPPPPTASQPPCHQRVTMMERKRVRAARGAGIGLWALDRPFYTYPNGPKFEM